MTNQLIADGLPIKNEQKILPKKDEQKINDFLLQNYNDLYSASKNKDEFTTNLEKKKKEDKNIKQLLETYKKNSEKESYFFGLFSKERDGPKEKDFNKYYGGKVDELTKRFEKEKGEEYQRTIDSLYGEISSLSSTVSSLNTQLSSRIQKEEQEKRKKIEKQKEFKKKEEEIKNEYFNNLQREDFENKECINVFMNYLKVKVEEKEEEEDEDIPIEGKDEDNEEKKEEKNEKTKETVIIEILKKLSEIENFEDKVKEEIIIYLKEILNDKTKKVYHLNILLLGKTGSGKSTLINVILELENTEKELKTDNKKPVTLKTEYIFSDKIDFLRCGDSRGIEVGKFGIESVQEEAEKFIDEQLKTNNPDFYVHCIWYCTIPITDRFQDDECKLLENLGNKYSMKEIPIIIVGTKANSKQSYMNLKQNIENNVYKFNYPFIPVIAKKLDDKEVMGLEELKELSIAKAKDAVESACYQGIFKKLILTSNEKIKNLELIIKEKIQEKEKIIIEKIEREGNLEVLKDDLKQLFTFILDSYLSVKLSFNEGEFVVNENVYSNEGEKMITDLINDYFKFCDDYSKKSYISILNDKINTLTEKIYNEQVNFNIINENAVQPKTKSIIQDEIKKTLDSKLNPLPQNKNFSKGNYIG